MNSMNSIEEIKKTVVEKFNVLNITNPMKKQLGFDFNSRDVHGVLAYLKSIGWKQMTLLTCIDWIKDNEFELVYVLFNWDNGITLQIKTKIPRDNPVFSSITAIYPGAQYYERDVHEFFGVKFQGNVESEKPLFLELWKELPPLRKDFDSKEFSYRKYGIKDNSKDFKIEVGDKK